MILQGDDNTKFFHLLANGRYRKTRITQLEQEEGIIVGQRNLMEYIYGMIYRNFNFFPNGDFHKGNLQLHSLNFGIITLAFLMGHFQGLIPHIWVERKNGMWQSILRNNIFDVLDSYMPSIFDVLDSYMHI
ncbi:hypothetical protein ACJX0J_040671 [Zea mays]